MSHKCNRCNKTQPVSQFETNHRMVKGHYNQCRTCRKLICKTWRNSDRGISLQRKKHLRRKYDISVEEYEVLYNSQGGNCAICNLDRKGNKNNAELCVDHCHVTGKVRGLLCSKCNTALGLFDDSRDNIKSALTYLNKGCAYE